MVGGDKRKPWSNEDEVALSKAHANISEDGSVATDQSSSKFWERIQDQYHIEMQIRPADVKSKGRCTTALQYQWSATIRPDVALYASCLAIVSTPMLMSM